MAENPRSPGEDGDPYGDDERPRILPPEEPNADDAEPWSHAATGRSLIAGDDGKPPSTTGALIAIGSGLVVTLAAIGIVVSMIAGGAAGKKPAKSPKPHAAPTQPSFPTTKPVPPSPMPPHQAIDLPRFPGEPATQTGRIEDHRAGLSYVRLGKPWRDGVPFTTASFTQGQYYVTEKYPQGTWQATIMSGRMAVRTPEYVGTYRWFRSAAAQAADVAGKYYPSDHRTLEVASQPVTVSGRSGWLTASRLYFHQQGLKATSELMVLVTVDTGRSEPGVLYISIPNTESRRLPDVNALVESLRVIK
jgi:hypothetical protein